MGGIDFLKERPLLKICFLTLMDVVLIKKSLDKHQGLAMTLLSSAFNLGTEYKMFVKLQENILLVKSYSE